MRSLQIRLGYTEWERTPSADKEGGAPVELEAGDVKRGRAAGTVQRRGADDAGDGAARFLGYHVRGSISSAL